MEKKKKRQHIKMGQWYTRCCHLDLERADKGFYEDIEDTPPLSVWNTKIEALFSLSLMWLRSGSIKNAVEAISFIFKKFN